MPEKDKLAKAVEAAVKSFYEEPIIADEPVTRFKRLEAVEVFATGKHNGINFTDQDLIDMEVAARELDYRPAVKIGHFENETGAPALGYMENIRKSGNKLLADLVDLQPFVYNDIRDKLYERVSLELFFNWRRNNKTYKKVIKAIALLGVEIPAVAGLKPLQAFKDTEYEKVASFNIEIDKEAKPMNDEEIKALKDQLAAQQAQLAQLNKFCETITTERDAAQAENAKFKADLEAERKNRIAETVKSKVAGVKVPALRDCFTSLYSVALTETTQVNFSDKGETPLETVIDALLEQVNKGADALFGEASGQGEPAKHEGEVTYEKAGKVISDIAKKYRAEHPEATFSTALKYALETADKDVVAAYSAVAE